MGPPDAAHLSQRPPPRHLGPGLPRGETGPWELWVRSRLWAECETEVPGVDMTGLRDRLCVGFPGRDTEEVGPHLCSSGEQK